jgi:glycine/D-amino acid oxidase-like deaminating enzyme
MDGIADNELSASPRLSAEAKKDGLSIVRGKSVIVIGAGVVGIHAALALLRKGFSVTLLEASRPAAGASFGNAGTLVELAIPTAQPGMTRKIPGWLLNPNGPLVIRAKRLPAALPWLTRYWLAASRRQFFSTARAAHTLQRSTLAGWRAALGEHNYRRFVRETGQVHLWEGPAAPPARSIEIEIRTELGIESQPLSAQDLRRIFPGISEIACFGLLLPSNSLSINPGAMVQALADTFIAEGGRLVLEAVHRLWPGDSGCWNVMTNFGQHRADSIVMAAGMWSERLLRPLGLRIPLESERGYHAILRGSGLNLRMPIMNKSRYFGLCSMEDGLRVSGTVEIAGMDAAPDLDRAKGLAVHARRLFPDISGEEVYWMGHRPSLPDGLPMIGPVAKYPGLNLCFAHGHSGLTAAPESAKLLADLMTGGMPAIDPQPYNPGRYID